MMGVEKELSTMLVLFRFTLLIAHPQTKTNNTMEASDKPLNNVCFFRNPSLYCLWHSILESIISYI